MTSSMAFNLKHSVCDNFKNSNGFIKQYLSFINP